MDGKLIKNQDYQIIDDIFNLREKGYGSFKIAKTLNEQGKTTISGKPFVQSSIETIVNNPIYQQEWT